ncbi:hypothetical protein RYX36_011871 [Vicia faba]
MLKIQNTMKQCQYLHSRLKTLMSSLKLQKGHRKSILGNKKTSQPKRSRANKEDHIMAERKQRGILSHNFISFASLVPNLKRMDKAYVLARSIKYVKEIKDRLEVLEEQDTNAEDVIRVQKESRRKTKNIVKDNSTYQVYDSILLISTLYLLQLHYNPSPFEIGGNGY